MKVNGGLNDMSKAPEPELDVKKAKLRDGQMPEKREAHATLSELSDSSGSLEASSYSSDRSEDYQQFERALRYKHSKACKAMSVSKD